LPQIIARATAWRAEHPGPAVIVVDHLQKVRGTKGKGISREQEVSGVSQGLKDLACDLKLPVIAPAQLNDGARFEKRGPQIGDTRESKGIEHDSDVVVGIQRKREEIKGMATLRVLKHRGGRIGDVKVTWHGAWQGFEPMTTEEERWTPAAPDDDEGGPSWDSRRK
jgi:replicative DNA helicase